MLAGAAIALVLVLGVRAVGALVAATERAVPPEYLWFGVLAASFVGVVAWTAWRMIVERREEDSVRGSDLALTMLFVGGASYADAAGAPGAATLAERAASAIGGFVLLFAAVVWAGWLAARQRGGPVWPPGQAGRSLSRVALFVAGVVVSLAGAAAVLHRVGGWFSG